MSNTKNITAPVVNMNGTSRKELLELHMTAWHAALTLLDALRKAAPHGRDFQTCPPHLYGVARAEHRARVVAIEQVIEDLRVLAEAISNQGRGA